MEVSNSGDETYNREGDGNENPKSESQSRSESPSSPCEQDAPAENTESPAAPSSSLFSVVEQRSVLVDSGAADNRSDDDNEQNNENSSPKLSYFPIQTEKDVNYSDIEESEVAGLIADIFGASDEEGEFEGFHEEDIATGKTFKPKAEKRKRATILSDSEDEKEEEIEKDEENGVIEDVPAPLDEDAVLPEESQTKKKKAGSASDDDVKIREEFVSDFDLMMQKKKENSKRRKRRHVDVINDSDDLIADIIAQMRKAAEEDKQLNKLKKTATKKLKILPMVLSQLKKQDLKMAFLDQGVLNVIAEWLTPLPDRSLPHLNIREGMLKHLCDYPNIDSSLLKASGIGRAVMYLYKHPKEIKENRDRARKLITEWSRPIYNVTINYDALTKEEREQRDYDHAPKRRKMKDQEASEAAVKRKDIDQEMTWGTTVIRPGDKGWIGRARVPMPSTKDYVNRPKWNVEMQFGRGLSKKPLSRIEKHMRSLQDKKRQCKQQRAITISIEGRKIAI